MSAKLLHGAALWLWGRTNAYGPVFRLGRALHTTAWRRGYRCDCLPF